MSGDCEFLYFIIFLINFMFIYNIR